MKKIFQILCFIFVAMFTTQGFADGYYDPYYRGYEYPHRQLDYSVPYSDIQISPLPPVQHRYRAPVPGKICKKIYVGGWYGPQGYYHPNYEWKCR